MTTTVSSGWRDGRARSESGAWPDVPGTSPVAQRRPTLTSGSARRISGKAETTTPARRQTAALCTSFIGRAVPVAIVASLLLTAAALAGPAPVNFSAWMKPTRIFFPHRTTLTYRLEMRSGPTMTGRPIEFRALTAIPLFGDQRMRWEGSPVDIESISFEGAATSQTSSGRWGLPACSPYTDQGGANARFTWHGYEQHYVEPDVVLRPNSTGAMVVQARTGDTAPWPSVDYRIRFEIRPPRPEPLDFLDPPETVEPQSVIPPKAPVHAGKSGVEISLTTSPPSAPKPSQSVPTVRVGREVRIRGETSPRIRGQFVILRYFQNGDTRDSPFRKLARVRVGRRGRFTYRGWRPRVVGRYELWAFYKTQRRNLVSDHACPRVFEVQR
jgi:hypothetical protein